MKTALIITALVLTACTPRMQASKEAARAGRAMKNADAAYARGEISFAELGKASRAYVVAFDRYLSLSEPQRDSFELDYNAARVAAFRYSMTR